MGDTKKTLEFQGEEPMGDASNYHPDAIVGFASNVNPAKVQQIGAAYEGIGNVFGSSLKVFQDMSQRLSEAWTGEDASVEASRQLALLYIAATTMQNNAKQIGGVIKNLGADQPDFSKQSVPYSGAYGIPATTSFETDSGTYGENGSISLAEFKNLVTSNSDFFAGKDVAPIIPSSTGGMAYLAVPTSDGKAVTVDRSLPPAQRGVYAQYLLQQQNNGIFSTWQGIPQTVTLDLPPAASNGTTNPKDKTGPGSKGPGSKGPGSKAYTGPGSTGPGSGSVPHLGNTGMPNVPGANPANLGGTGHTGGSDLASLPGSHPGGGTDLSGVDPTTGLGGGPGGGTSLGTPPNIGTGGGGTSLGTPPGLGGTGPSTGLGGNNSLSPYTPGLIGSPGGGLGKSGLGLGKGGVGGADPLGLKSPVSGSTAENGTVARGAVNAAAAEEGAIGAAAAANRAGGMMPMMPPMMGGQNGQQQDRERSAWLTEDEDIWTADDDVAPPLIG